MSTDTCFLSSSMGQFPDMTHKPKQRQDNSIAVLLVRPDATSILLAPIPIYILYLQGLGGWRSYAVDGAFLAEIAGPGGIVGINVWKNGKHAFTMETPDGT